MVAPEEKPTEEGYFDSSNEVRISINRLSMAEIYKAVEMRDDREARGEPKQEAEVYDDIAQNAEKQEEFEHGESWKFHGKTDRKGSVVACLQESNIEDEDMNDDQSNLVTCDFFSVRESKRHAVYFHGQAVEVARPLRLNLTSSICSPPTPLSMDEDEQPLSRRERNMITMAQHSKLALISSRAVPYRFTRLELPANLPYGLGAGVGRDSRTRKRKTSETFEIRKLRSFFQPMDSEKISTIVFGPRSPFLNELNDRKSLYFSQDEGNCSAAGDVRTIFHRQAGEKGSEGTQCEFVVKMLPSISRILSASKNSITRVPESLSFALPKQKSELEDAQVPRSTQVTPPSITSVASSQFANFETEIGIVNEQSLSKGMSSHHRSEENDAVSESGIVEKCKHEDLILTLDVQKSEASTGGKSEGGCALDLLVSAIQVTSGGRFSREDVPGPSEIIESVIEPDNDAHYESEEVFFLYGRSPIVKKRVIRRARNAFKEQHGGNSLLHAMRFRLPEFVGEVNFERRKRKTLPDEKHGRQQKEHEANLGVPQVAHLKDGDPLIRSKRGRYQVLPTKFSDSVLQPWKRMPRRKHTAKFKRV